MFRLVFLTFFGKPRFDVEHVHPHESPALMTIPLVILAAVTIFFGAVGYPPDAGRFHKFLEPVFAAGEVHEAAVIAEDDTHEAEAGETAAVADELAHEEGEHHISNRTIISVRRDLDHSGPERHRARLAGLPEEANRSRRFCADHSRLYGFLYNKWYFDEVYNAGIVLPLRRFAMYLWTVIDVKVIDGTLMGVARGVEELSQGLRTVQTGLVRNYALAIALGMVVIVGVYFAAFSDLFR